MAASDESESVPGGESYRHSHGAGRSVALRLQAGGRRAGYSSRWTVPHQLH